MKTMPEVHFFLVSPAVFCADHAYSSGVIDASVETYIVRLGTIFYMLKVGTDWDLQDSNQTAKHPSVSAEL
jgi:hypothetical protein